MSLPEESANKHLCDILLYINIEHFFKLMIAVVPLERWVQLMSGRLKTVNLAWVNRIPLIGNTWLFVHEITRSYEGRMNATLGYCDILKTGFT